MEQKSLLYSHFSHLAQQENCRCIITEPQALLDSWQLQAPEHLEMAALDMALACLFQHLQHYFADNVFADRLTAAAELLVAARQEEDDLTCRKLVEELNSALAAADAACDAKLLYAAEEERPLE